MRARITGVVLIFFLPMSKYFSPPDRTYMCMYDSCLSEASIYYAWTLHACKFNSIASHIIWTTLIVARLYFVEFMRIKVLWIFVYFLPLHVNLSDNIHYLLINDINYQWLLIHPPQIPDLSISTKYISPCTLGYLEAPIISIKNPNEVLFTCYKVSHIGCHIQILYCSLYIHVVMAFLIWWGRQWKCHWLVRYDFFCQFFGIMWFYIYIYFISNILNSKFY